MRIFVTKVFARFARKERLADRHLTEAIERAARGLVNADLGGGLIKQRVARPGGGRSGAYRTVIAFRAEHRSVFLYGFAKSARDNIDDREMVDLRKLAKIYLGLSAEQIALALAAAELSEVTCDDQSKV